MLDSLNNPKHTFLSGGALKIIAMVTMVIDHFGAYILLPWINLNFYSPDTTPIVDYYTISRAIGRLAFPIFCFLLVEGAHHTRDINKYMLRLGIFALVSEIPFDLARGLNFFDFSYQNVFFTLLLGLAAIAVIQKSNSLPVKILGVAVAAYLSYLLKTDYDIIGVLLIVVLYTLREFRFIQSMAGIIAYLEYNFYGIPAFILTYFYNGERGRFNTKWFYAFYPVHLLIYAGIRYYIFNT